MTGADDDITQGEMEQLFKTITDDPQTVADRLNGITSIEGIHTTSALNLIGLLVDASGDIGDTDGLTRALDLSRELGERDLSPGDRTRLNYRIANAYSQRRKLAWQNHDPWVWEDERLEQEILHFRRALTTEGFDAVEPHEQAQIYTNLGNAFSEVGRIIEAIDCWQTALQCTPGFAPARG